MSTDLNIRIKGWIRWVGAVCSLGILFMVALAWRGVSDPLEATGLVGLGLLPAFVSLFASLAQRFWFNLIVGLWYLFVGVSACGETRLAPFFLLASLTLSSTPILNKIFCKKMSTPYQPSETERQGAPEAFKYEMEMFCYSEGHLSNAQGNPRKAMIECALLHARNLLDFFTGNQPMMGRIDQKTIRAGHFIKENTWWKSDKLPNLQKRKKDINKALSHLSYDRIGAGYRWNDLPKIREEIKSAYAEFHKLLPEEERTKWPEPKDS